MERRWCAELPPGQRYRYGASRQLLRQQLADLLAMPVQQVPLRSPPGAPPELAPGFGHVSLSHSGDQLLTAWSPEPIGVDLEWSQRALATERLARRFFPPVEASRLLELPPEQGRRAFLESWVRKEAAIKWQRTSLGRDLHHWCWDEVTQTLEHQRLGCRPPSLCVERNGWLCAAVGEAVGRGVWG